MVPLVCTDVIQYGPVARGASLSGLYSSFNTESLAITFDQVMVNQPLPIMLNQREIGHQRDVHNHVAMES
jgi:hypothetical protein